MAAARRAAAWACAAVLLLAACSYGPDERGLFPTAPVRSGERPTPTERTTPQPTNPELPVAGERLWVSGISEVPIRVRIAVHAVRRVEGATVLDWSITPIASPGYGFGDVLPATDLGLEQATRVRPAVTLLDPGRRTAYQPLVRDPREDSHCLCTPVRRVRRDLRVGETRLLQVAFPALPGSLTHVDVGVLTVTPFRHVPVSPLGMVPVATRPTDLARPEEPTTLPPTRIDFANPPGSSQFQWIHVARVLAAPGRTTLEWTLTSVHDQEIPVLDYAPPVESRPPKGVAVRGSSQASGPVLRGGPVRLHSLWTRTSVAGRTAYECQCTEIGLWAAGLRYAGTYAVLVTNYPALPGGTRTVDVELPGYGTLRDIAVVPVEDAARNLAPPVPAEVGRWTYETDDPPPGWPTAEWPTDTPDPAQLDDYVSSVEPIVGLPTRR